MRIDRKNKTYKNIHVSKISHSESVGYEEDIVKCCEILQKHRHTPNYCQKKRKFKVNKKKNFVASFFEFYFFSIFIFFAKKRELPKQDLRPKEE